MSSTITGRDDSRDRADPKIALKGWAHLQQALGRSLHQNVKRSRKLAQARLRGRK